MEYLKKYQKEDLNKNKVDNIKNSNLIKTSTRTILVELTKLNKKLKEDCENTSVSDSFNTEGKTEIDRKTTYFYFQNSSRTDVV